MSKFLALYKVFMIDTLNNKFAFVFNLLLPTGYFLYSNWKLIFNPVDISESQILSGLEIYWAYIIFTTILNMVIFPTVFQRESGYYKEFYFIIGSKWKIFLANFVVQATVLMLEIIIFDLIVTLVVRSWSWTFFLGGILSALFFMIPVTLISSLFLTFRIKLQSISVIITITIFVSFSLVNISVHNWLGNLILLLNPIQYLIAGSHAVSSFLGGNLDGFQVIMQVTIVTLIYIMLGIWSLSRFDIKPILNRA